MLSASPSVISSIITCTIVSVYAPASNQVTEVGGMVPKILDFIAFKTQACQHPRKSCPPGLYDHSNGEEVNWSLHISYLLNDSKPLHELSTGSMVLLTVLSVVPIASCSGLQPTGEITLALILFSVIKRCLGEVQPLARLILPSLLLLFRKAVIRVVQEIVWLAQDTVITFRIMEFTLIKWDIKYLLT